MHKKWFFLIPLSLIMFVNISLTNVSASDKATEAVSHKNIGDEYRFKDYEKSIAEYNVAIRLNPRYAEAYFNRGCIYLDNKNAYDAAISDFNQAIAIKADYSAAYCRRGDAYQKKKNYTQAISDYTRAIELNNKYNHAYGQRANCYYEIGDYDNAIADAKHIGAQSLLQKASDAKRNMSARTSEQKQAVSLKKTGDEYFNQGKYNEAIEVYTTVINYDNQYIDAYKMRGDSFYKRAYTGNKDYADFDRAIDDYNKVINLDPNYKSVVLSNLILAYNNRGVNFRTMGLYDKAIAYHSRVLELKPQDAHSYDMRGRAYHEKGDYARAIADYKQYLRFYPNDVYAKKRLQQALQKRK